MKQKKTGQQNTNKPPTKADRKLTIQLLKENCRFYTVDMAENRPKIFSWFMIRDIFSETNSWNS